jgi:hypothetical protein
MWYILQNNSPSTGDGNDIKFGKNLEAKKFNVLLGRHGGLPGWETLFELNSIMFWRRHVTLRTNGFVDFVHRPEI